MAGIAFILSIIALILSYLAYRRSGGSPDELRAKVEELGITTENLRKRTADALNRLEKRVRGENHRASQEEPAGDREVIDAEPVDRDTKGK